MTEKPLQAALEVLTPILDKSVPAARAYGLMVGYHQRWVDAPYRILDVEATVLAPLVNPETATSSRSFQSAGKIDIHAEELKTGRRVIFDHKTTSDDIEDPSGTYWQQLVIEGQASHYLMLEWLNGRKVDYAVWDAMRKAQTSPKEIAKKDRVTALATSTYCDLPITEEEKEFIEAHERESNSLYVKRLIQDCAIQRPGRFFQRRQVPRLDAEIRQYAEEQWGHSQDMLLARRQNRWPRNGAACMSYGRPCKYLGVCSGHDEIDSPKWTRKQWVHPELVQIEGSTGKDLLTNSRLKKFQLCRKLHYYDYELGVEKVEPEEDAESLYFGTLWHETLEAYFRETMKEQL
jgi:hypothetical protein